MTDLKESPAWQALAENQQEVDNLHMRDLFAADPQRFARFSLRVGDILFDYPKNRITEKTILSIRVLGLGWRALLSVVGN